MEELSNGERTGLRQALQLAGIAAAGVFSLLLLIPSVILSGNLDEFASPFILMAYFAAAATVGVFALWLLFCMLPLKVSKFLSIGIVAYAIVCLVFDAILPVGIGELEFGHERAAAAPLWGSVVQVLGVAGLLALLWNMHIAVLGSMGWIFAAVIASASFAPLAFEMIPTSEAASSEEVSQSNATAPPYNIYHVLFDCYYGPWFEWALSELNLDENGFAGFTHYTSARSNHWSTSNSYPSFLSGTTYDSAQTIVVWRKSQQNSSLVTDLNERGFNTSLYAPYDRKGYGPMFLAAKERHFLPERDARLADQGSELWLMLDLWALRIAPVGLRHLVFQEGSGPFSKYVDAMPPDVSKGYSSLQNFLKFLGSENERADHGNYLHVYVSIPHPPSSLDRSGRYIGKRSDYMEEMLLATNMMAMLVDRLKKLNRFENSFIIFQSDHGAASAAHYRGKGLLDTVRMDEGTSDRIGRDSLSGYSGREIEARLSPLLLVKTPGSCSSQTSFRKDDSLVQLLDLRRFVKGLTAGSSLDCTYPKHDAVDVNVDRVRIGHEDVNPGKRAPSGNFQRFRVHADGTWQELPNMHFTYE